MAPPPRPSKVLLACVVALLLCGPAFAATRGAPSKVTPSKAGNNTFLWKVTPKDAPPDGAAAHTVYLLGSVHVGTPDFYPLPKEIEQAFDASKKLVVEVDTEKAGLLQVQGLLMEKGMYRDGDTLADHVAPATLKQFRAYCERNGLPAEALERFRPWASAMTVTMTEVQRQGFRADLGIDEHFMQAARKADKPVLELESAESQIEVLAGLGPELEEQFLLSTLSETGDGGKRLTDESMRAWQSGDADRLKALMIDRPIRESPQMKKVTQKLLDDRNGPMADKVEGYMKAGDGPHFVVVGAGHLVGEQGIVQRLAAKKDYQVEQVRKGAPAGAKEPSRIQITPRSRKPVGAGR
jgi:uncharacterized protein YbaP (TraB family)